MTVTAEEIDDGVVRLRCRTWRGAAVGYDVSAYVVHDVLVDTGFALVRDDFLRALDRLSVRGAVVTHQHEDHAGNVVALAERGLPIAMHAECESVLRARPSIGLYRHATWGQPPRLTAPLAAFDVTPLELISLPGHTSDHLAVWHATDRVLVSGDLFLGVKVRVAHHDESPRRLIDSLRAAAALNPRLLLDAHRGPIADPAPLLRAKASWLEATVARVVEAADRGETDSEIARRVLGRESLVGWASFGEYSKRALVQAMLRDRVP